MGTPNKKRDEAWAEAKHRCRLNQADIAMAKKLGLTPRSLIKNIPSKHETWKVPVKQWLHDLYDKKYGSNSNKPLSNDDLPF